MGIECPEIRKNRQTPNCVIRRVEKYIRSGQRAKIVDEIEKIVSATISKPVNLRVNDVILISSSYSVAGQKFDK